MTVTLDRGQERTSVKWHLGSGLREVRGKPGPTGAEGDAMGLGTRNW